MRFVLLSLLLVLTAVVHASISQLTLRELSIDQIQGFYSLVRQFGPGCPRNITHQENPDDENAIPHDTIDMNEQQCDPEEGSKEMIVYDDPEEAKEQLDDEVAQSVVDDFSEIEGVFYGVETEARLCDRVPSANSRLAAGTLVMFFRLDEAVTVGGVPYRAGVRYMVISEPGETLCIYRGRRFIRPSPSPMQPASPAPIPPTTEPSPSESPSPEPDTQPPTTPPSTGGTGPGGSGAGSGGSGGTGSDDDSSAIPSPSPMEDDSLPPGETPTPDGSPGGDGDDDDDDPICFPADATVELEDGSVKTMALVQLGDRVKVGDGVFSDVFMFTHKDASSVHEFVEISTDAGVSLSVTRGHYIYINDAIAAASTVKVGDVVELGNGEKTFVSDVSEVSKIGLYNPQTVHGDIIVNSMRASTYTRVIEPPAAQALMAPLRLLYGALGWSVSFLNNGADSIAQLLPRGQAEL